jgi:hypothetical protein
MTFDIWNLNWSVLPGQSTFDGAHQRITAISRVSTVMDLFAVGPQDRVYSTFWNYQTGGWSPDWFPVPGPGPFDIRQQVAAVARTPQNLDLFIVGDNGLIYTTYWTQAGSWNSNWFAVPGATTFDVANQQVAAVSRAPGNIDLFAVHGDGKVYTTYWNQAAGWNKEWFPVGKLSPFDVRQKVAVVSRTPQNLDLFIVGDNGTVYTTYWTQAGGWNADWFPLPGATTFDVTHQSVVAVSRAPGNMDLFAMHGDGKVYSTYWSQAGGWSQGWFQVPGQMTFDAANQHVTAVSRSSVNLDLYVIGGQNIVYSAYWNGSGGGWSPEWGPVPGQPVPAIAANPHPQVAVVSHGAHNLDVFVFGADGHAWTNFFCPRNPMTLDVTTGGVPVGNANQERLELDILATDGLVTETSWSMRRNGAPVPGSGGSTPSGAEWKQVTPILEPGDYDVTVSRTGWTAPGNPTTLTKQIQFVQPAPAPVPPPAATTPTITATFNGSNGVGTYEVKGSGFEPNRPASNQGVLIRFVDATSLQTLHSEYVASSASGTFDDPVKLDLSGLQVNAAKQAIVAISATDGRANPSDATGLLWSNTVRITFTGA